MKGTYINTVIMMAALSGKKSRRLAAEKETVHSMNDYKIIWSKDRQASKTANNKPESTLP